MSAYATARSGRALSPITCARSQSPTGESSLLDAVIADLAERIADAVVSRLGATQEQEAVEWLDSRDAAAYLGVHRDTLRKLAAERAIATHQEGRGCKLFFRRSELDEWRRSGGRSAHLSAVVTQAA
jgi:excisionase family DNA binding protein